MVVMNGNQMMVNGNVASPMRVVTTGGSGGTDGNTVAVAMNGQGNTTPNQAQGIVMANATNNGQKIVQLVMAQPATPTTPQRVVGK